MMKAQQTTPAPGNLKVYKDQMRQLQNLRDGYTNPKTGKFVAGFNEMAMATGRFGVETVKTVSATERLTDSIMKQKLGFSQAMRSMGTFKNAWREQAAIQQASAMQWQGSMTGKNKTDLYVPKGVGKDLDGFRTKYGYINEAIGSIAHQTINWGKNTQWAGRQIMVGIGVPLAMAGGLMAKLAFDADKQLTRISKVYDGTDFSKMGVTDATDQALLKEQELVQVRKNAMDDGSRMAKQYGAALSDTLKLEADLAATGVRGTELRNTTEQVTRIATLGELDHQTALDMTITLMSTLNQKAGDLANTFNYMNAIENATSLSTQDFAEALPRMAGALTGLGVSVQEMGIMMTALKEGGVDAAEGANALKSATTRVLRPTAAAQAAFSGMGVTIEDVVARNGGNLFKILNSLGASMKGYPALQKQAAMAALFGTYQFNRLNVVMSNLADVTSGDVPEGFSQTAKAAEIAGQETGKWAAAASLELAKQANSVSGRFKRAVETVKVELAKLGEPILAALVPIAEFVGRLISGFNGMPDIFKKIIGGLAVFGLIMGPLIMLVGLSGNLIGNFVKFASNVANLGLRFKSMTAEQRASELMTRRAASAFNSESSSIALLTINMKKMIAVLEQQALAQQKSALMAGGMTGRQAAAATAQRAPKGSPGGGRFESQAQRDARAAAETAASAEKTRMSMMGVASAAAGLGMGVMAINNMKNGTGGILELMMNVAMVAASIQMTGLGSGVAALMKKETWTKMGASIGGVFTKALDKAKRLSLIVKTAAVTKWTAMNTGLSSAVGLMGKMRVIMAAMMGPAGWVALGVGVLVAGAAFFLNQQDSMLDKQRAINDNAEKLAETYGYAYKEGSLLGQDVDVDSINGRREAVIKLREEHEELVSVLENTTDKTELFHIAMQDAVKMVTSGGDAAAARLHFQTMLQAAGLDEVEIDKLSVRYDAVDIGKPDNLRHAINRELNHLLSDVEMPELEIIVVTSLDALDEDSVAALETSIRMISAQLTAFGDDYTGMSDFMRDVGDSIDKLFDKPWDEWFNSIDEGFQNKLRNAGIDSIGELQTYMDENPGAFKVEFDALDYGPGGAGEALRGLQYAYSDMLKKLMDGLVQKGQMTQTEADGILADNFPQMHDIMNEIGADLLTLEEAQNGYADAMARAGLRGVEYTEKQKLAILNTWRAKRGLDAATNSAQGFGPKLISAAEAAQTLAEALAFDPATSIITHDQGTELLRNSFSNAMGYVYDRADKLASAAEDASADAIQRGGERRQKALDKRGKDEDKYYDGRQKDLEAALKAEEDAFDDAWDAREKGLDDQIDRESDAFDAKIKLIEDEIDALDAADEEREKLFDRERTRISRLAELANGNIDFNMALNSGNIDEAAKIYNSSAASVQQWAIDDENARLQDANDAKRKTLEDKIKAIEGEKEARLAALEAEKEALAELRNFEEEQMKARADARKADLDAEKEAARERLDADKESSRQATQNRLDNDKRQWESRKTTLDMELATIKSSTPKTMEEYNNQVAQIEAAYKEYGVDLVGYGNEWTSIIGEGLTAGTAQAAAELQNTIGWQKMGEYISQQVGNGTGLTMESIKTFLQTGKFPATEAPQATPWTSQQQAQRDQNMRSRGYIPLGNGRYRAPGGGVTFAHIGGQAGEGPSWSQKDRAGVPRSASQYPSEYKAVLKRGEFVVNAKDARKNIDILRAINGGRSIPVGDPGLRGVNAAKYFNGLQRSGEINGIHHAGGLIDSTAGVSAGFGNVLLSVTDMVANKAAEMMRNHMDRSDANSMPYIGGTGGNVRKVLDTARREQGKPYIWGGAGAAGSDCSGFMSIIQNAVYGKNPPYGRRWATGSFVGGREIDGWKRGGSSKDVFRIGVDPNSHVVGNFAGINVESGSGHGPMVGGRALGPNTFGRYKYYLPAANNLPQLRAGGKVKYDNTLANLHKGETVLTAPLTERFMDNVASGSGNEYNVEVNFNGTVNSELDVTKAVRKAIEDIENKNGRKRVIR